MRTFRRCSWDLALARADGASATAPRGAQASFGAADLAAVVATCHRPTAPRPPRPRDRGVSSSWPGWRRGEVSTPPLGRRRRRAADHDGALLTVRRSGTSGS